MFPTILTHNTDNVQAVLSVVAQSVLFSQLVCKGKLGDQLVPALKTLLALLPFFVRNSERKKNRFGEKN